MPQPSPRANNLTNNAEPPTKLQPPNTRAKRKHSPVNTDSPSSTDSADTPEAAAAPAAAEHAQTGVSDSGNAGSSADAYGASGTLLAENDGYESDNEDEDLVQEQDENEKQRRGQRRQEKRERREREERERRERREREEKEKRDKKEREEKEKRDKKEREEKEKRDKKEREEKEKRERREKEEREKKERREKKQEERKDRSERRQRKKTEKRARKDGLMALDDLNLEYDPTTGAPLEGSHGRSEKDRRREEKHREREEKAREKYRLRERALAARAERLYDPSTEQYAFEIYHIEKRPIYIELPSFAHDDGGPQGKGRRERDRERDGAEVGITVRDFKVSSHRCVVRAASKRDMDIWMRKINEALSIPYKAFPCALPAFTDLPSVPGESCNWLNIVFARYFKEVKHSPEAHEKMISFFQVRFDRMKKQSFLGPVSVISVDFGTQAAELREIKCAAGSTDGEIVRRYELTGLIAHTHHSLIAQQRRLVSSK